MNGRPRKQDPLWRTCEERGTTCSLHACREFPELLGDNFDSSIPGLPVAHALDGTSNRPPNAGLVGQSCGNSGKRWQISGIDAVGGSYCIACVNQSGLWRPDLFPSGGNCHSVRAWRQRYADHGTMHTHDVERVFDCLPPPPDRYDN